MKNVLFVFCLLVSMSLSAQQMVMTGDGEAIAELREGFEGMGHDNFGMYNHTMKALRIDETCFMANAIMALISGGQGNIEDAQAYTAKALANAEGINEGEMIFKDMLMQAGDTSYEASVDMAKLAAMYPKDASILLMTAYVFGSEGNGAECVELCKRALELGEYAGAYNLMGYGYLGMGEMDAAKEAFMNYRRSAPDHPNPHDSMGDYLMAAEEYEEAALSYERAYEIDPDRYTISKEKAEKARDMMD